MKHLFSILEYGAKPGSEHSQTQAIQKAIDEADQKGGTVVIPRGVFKTGTLNLKGADLYLEKGAVLLGSEHKEDYYANGYLHCEFGETYSLLYSIDHRDISIYGQGVIDLNGKQFFNFNTWNLPDEWKDRCSEEQKQESTALFEWRPNQSIFFHACEHVTIRDITILDASCWTLTFSQCDQVLVDGITNIGHPRVPNNDAIHISASKNVIISNCNLTSADDCIAISSITNWSVPCENITITNCILKSFSKAIVLGYSHSIVRNVTISNCQIKESNRAFCIMAASKTGLVENVTVSNMRLDTRVRAGNWWGNGEPVFIFALPYTTKDHVDHTQELEQRNFPVSVRNIFFQNLICTSENAAGVVGENNIENVVFENVLIQLKKSDNLLLKGRRFDTAPSAVQVFLPEDENTPCIFLSQGAAVQAHHVFGYGTNGKEGSVMITE